MGRNVNITFPFESNSSLSVIDEGVNKDLVKVLKQALTTEKDEVEVNIMM